jgi:hypothetical protein
MSTATANKQIDMKGALTVLVSIAVLVVLIIIVKNISNLFKSGSEGLGLTNSDTKQFVNQVYASQDSPLFSNEFDKMQPKAPNNAPLKTVAEMHTYIEQLKDARGFLFDDDSAAVGVFDNFSTQFMVAWFAKRFQVETGNDLFTWMRKEDTLFSQGFAAGTVNAIIKKVNALPRY